MPGVGLGDMYPVHIPTAPLRSMVALSTMVNFTSFSLAQCPPSMAAPAQAIPAPITKRSVFTSTVLNSSIIHHLL